MARPKSVKKAKAVSVVKEEKEEEPVEATTSDVEQEEEEDVLDLGEEGEDEEQEEEDEEEEEAGDEDEMEEEDGDMEQEKEEEPKKTGGKLINPELKQKKSGVLYFPSLPPFFTVARLRAEMSRFGEVGRIYLTKEKRRDAKGKPSKKFTEGWVEFTSKSLAKRIALSLHNTTVGGSRRSAARDSLWSIKYLSGFKWVHLQEQLAYEKRVSGQRMRAEIGQAKRQAEHFADQIEKGAHLKRLEEKVLKKGGKWEQFERQVEQRRVVKAGGKKANKGGKTAVGGGGADDELMKMIFAE